MDRNKRLQEIADSINAATKIKNLYSSNLRTRPDTAVRSSNISLLDEVVQILREGSLAGSRKGLSDTLQRTYELSHTYRNLKSQINTTRNSKADLQTIFGFLETIRPALGHRSFTYVDKLLKINEIIKS